MSNFPTSRRRYKRHRRRRSDHEARLRPTRNEDDQRQTISPLPTHVGFAENRQRKVRDIKATVPLYRDTRNQPWDEEHGFNVALHSTLFSPGGCGLQVTFGADTLAEAHVLHDQLAPIGPVVTALTAGSPVQRGRLLATDLRWNQLAAISDDRTESQRKQLPLAWSISPTHLAHDCNDSLPADFHSPAVVFEEHVRATLETEAGIDPVMARFLAHTQMRDPLRLTQADIDATGTDGDTKIFEKVYSAHWPHCRLKFPFEAAGGWRVEFRPMEIQPSDFENATFAVFMCLVRQAVAHFHLDRYMPISLVAENMHRAHAQDAVLTQKFWFRRNSRGGAVVKAEDVVLMSAEEIICGSDAAGDGMETPGFPGFVPLVLEFLTETWGTGKDRDTIEKYLDLVQGRASGRVPTPAQWMRDFVQTHAGYRQDSIVGPDVCYHLLMEIVKKSRARRVGQLDSGARLGRVD